MEYVVKAVQEKLGQEEEEREGGESRGRRGGESRRKEESYQQEPLLASHSSVF